MHIHYVAQTEPCWIERTFCNELSSKKKTYKLVTKVATREERGWESSLQLKPWGKGEKSWQLSLIVKNPFMPWNICKRKNYWRKKGLCHSWRMGHFVYGINYTPIFAMNPSVENFLWMTKSQLVVKDMCFKQDNKRLKQQKLTLEKSTKLLDHNGLFMIDNRSLIDACRYILFSKTGLNSDWFYYVCHIVATLFRMVPTLFQYFNAVLR